VRPRWLRSLAIKPSEDGWIYWQYHNMGRVDGIEGDVDLNVLQGGQQTLAELFAPSAQPSPSP
jgi:lysozyme